LGGARLVEQFATFGIPVQPGGRSGLFDQPEAVALGRAIAWLTDTEWREPYQQSRPIAGTDLFAEFQRVFVLSDADRGRVARFLAEWKKAAPRTDRTADLVGELYELLAELDVKSWDLSDPIAVNRLGTLARFSSLLADYESVRRRSRSDPDLPGEQVGGEDRGTWYYRNLALHIINYAQGAYEGFDGEADFALNAVDLTTVHRAKGLEWPVVFVPSMTAGRFPSSRTGSAQEWLVPRDRFNAFRYEGSDGDERRLFYVAMTRARDWLSVSRHEKVTKRAVAASPYYLELAEHQVEPENISPPAIESGTDTNDEALAITSAGGVIRTRVADVRRTGRTTMGVRLINLGEGDSVVAIARNAESIAPEILGEVLNDEPDGDEAGVGGGAEPDPEGIDVPVRPDPVEEVVDDAEQPSGVTVDEDVTGDDAARDATQEDQP